MAVTLAWDESEPLRKRLAETVAGTDPQSRKVSRLRTEVKKVIAEDNEDKLLGRGLLEGVDRYGRPLAEMAPSTYQNPRRGLGPVLAPRGRLSRTIANLRVSWVLDGDRWRCIVGWVNVVSKKGVHFLIYHLQGASDPKRPNWHLPKRDIAGLTPKGWAQLRGVFSDFRRRAAKRGD